MPAEKKEPCPWFVHDVWTGVYYTCFFSPSDGTDGVYEMQMRGFSRRIAIGAFNKLAIFLARYPAPGTHQLALRFSRTPKESFIDEIVNTADRRMFCLSRPDVYPSRSATTRCVSPSPAAKRDSTSSTILSLSLTIHLNELCVVPKLRSSASEIFRAAIAARNIFLIFNFILEIYSIIFSDEKYEIH